MAQRRQPGDRGYRCPPSEHDPMPHESATKFQRFRNYAAEHKDDGWHAPVSSDDLPPSHSR